jgi:hypothetical protein
MSNTIPFNSDLCIKLKETLNINDVEKEVVNLKSENTILKERIKSLENYITVLSSTYKIVDSNNNLIKFVL